jgi:hypothetical protein
MFSQANDLATMARETGARVGAMLFDLRGRARCMCFWISIIGETLRWMVKAFYLLNQCVARYVFQVL